ncbi:lipopolysaccharide heptosyltransferase II [Chitinibacteraceae bacterium HSL-7]
MKQILIVAPAWVGDAVMAQPLYRVLAERYPGVAIDVLAPSWTRPLHARMREIRHAIDAPFGHGELALKARWALGRELSKTGYDQVILLPNSLKSALVPFFAGIRTRTGWLGESRYGLLNDWRRLDKTALPRMVQRFVALGADADAPLPDFTPPELVVDPASTRAVMQRLGLDTSKPVLALCPGAEYGPAKRWPARHAGQLASDYLARGWQVWLLGSNKDHDICRDIAAIAPGVANLAGQTALADAIDLMAAADAVVCNDSGLMHVAAALGRPLVATYGSSSPIFTPPLSERARVVSLELSCSPCFKRECPLGHLDCLEKLEPARIAAEIDDLTAPPTPPSAH